MVIGAPSGGYQRVYFASQVSHVANAKYISAGNAVGHRSSARRTIGSSKVSFLFHAQSVGRW